LLRLVADRQGPEGGDGDLGDRAGVGGRFTPDADVVSHVI